LFVWLRIIRDLLLAQKKPATKGCGSRKSLVARFGSLQQKGSGPCKSLVARFGSLQQRVLVLARAWLHGLEACNIGLWFLQELGCTVWKPATKGFGSSNSLVARFGSLQQRVLVLATARLHGLEACNKGFWF